MTTMPCVKYEKIGAEKNHKSSIASQETVFIMEIIFLISQHHLMGLGTPINSFFEHRKLYRGDTMMSWWMKLNWLNLIPTYPLFFEWNRLTSLWNYICEQLPTIGLKDRERDKYNIPNFFPSFRKKKIKFMLVTLG